jgi:outer membrane receptor protein involved in Fe transport
MNKILATIVSIILSVQFGIAQNEIVIKGNIKDKTYKEALIGAAVMLKGTNTGAVTDIEGNFELNLPSETKFPLELEISYLGYQTIVVSVQNATSKVIVEMEEGAVYITDEVVITGSRVSERITESNSSIQKLNALQIQNSASGNFYQSMGNLKEIDVTTSSAGFQIINTRGFNTTAPVRMVQFIDGMDNQAPGLNFPVGNLVGASEIDLESVEIISGASSALYGANAFQGVVAMKSKSPFDHPGLQVKLKGGTRAMFEGQIRYANSFGKREGAKDKFGYKFTCSYYRINDWVADDSVANLYGDVSTSVNVSSIVRKLQYSEDTAIAKKFRALNTYLDFYPVAFPGILGITTPGYMEEDVSDNKVQSLKASMGLYWNIQKDLQLSYDYKFGRGSAIYQGSNRYAIKNILFQQNKVQLEGKGMLLKYYNTLENAGDSYDMVFTSINISKDGIADYVSNFISEYFGKLSEYNNDFKDEPNQENVNFSKKYAIEQAYAQSFYSPDSEEFKTSFNRIVADPDLKTGSKFLDKSALHHVEGQYNYDLKYANLIFGASYRMFHPNSSGTIFRDTLREDGTYENLNTWEAGGYAQASVNLFKNHLKLVGSMRLDKNKNFDLQLSPRVSAVFTYNKHTLRVSGQSAFRSPTLQNQYILLDIGPLLLQGNLDGNYNVYDLQSVTDFKERYENEYIIDTSLLKAVTIDPLKQEQVKSIEAGYRTQIFKNLYIDANGYFNIYSNFIGDIRLAEPLEPGQAGEQTGVDAILTKNYRVIQTPTNAKQDVKSYGASIALTYYLPKNLITNFNYTYANINTKSLTDPIIPGFNTPNHKFNIGFSGNKVWKGLGFAANFKWSDNYQWQSPFGNGNVPAYHTLDLQISYELDKFFTFQVGGSNIYNHKYRTAYGSPIMGALGYASVLFDLERKGKN